MLVWLWPSPANPAQVALGAYVGTLAKLLPFLRRR